MSKPDSLIAYIRLHTWLLLLCLAGYLVAAHYVKAYSDPVGFLFSAELLGAGTPNTERPLLYPAYLLVMLKLLGRSWVFLSNLPLVLLLCVLVGKTAQLLRDEKAEDQSWMHLLGFTTLALFVAANVRFLLEMLNPFREPLAFSMMLGSVVMLIHAHQTKKKLWWGFAGLLLGLASSTRETCILLALPVGLWLLLMIRKESFKTLRMPLLIFVLGGGLGIAPFLIQNYIHSGRALIGSYFADKYDNLAEEETVDIPVPGMSKKHFSKTSLNTAKHLLDKYTLPGFFLFVLGAVWAFRNHRRNSLLLLGGMLVNLLFYSFYSYSKERYLLVVELFYAPFIAAGLLLLLLAMVTLTRKQSSSMLFMKLWVSLLVAIILGLQIHQLAKTRGSLSKVWEIAAIRDTIKPHLEAPYTFVGHRHFAQILTWHLEGEPPFEPQRVFSYQTGNDIRTPFSQKLATYSTNILSRVSNGPVYYYGDEHPRFIRSWCDFEKVFTFSEMKKAPERYGGRMWQSLYRMTPWKNREVPIEVTLPSPGKRHLLMLDLYQLMDFPGRTRCELEANGRVFPLALTNGLQFVELPADLPKDLLLTFRSDQPLPQKPLIKLQPVNQTLTLNLGYESEPAWFPMMSPDLLTLSPMKGDSCLLFEKGRIRFPVYAETNEEVYVSFKAEFFQEDSYFRNKPFSVTAYSGDHEKQTILPGRRQSTEIGLRLGRGTGKLNLVPVDFKTTIPSITNQMAMMGQPDGIVNDLGYVKLYRAEFVTVSATPVSELKIDVGASSDLPYLDTGFYQREKHPEVKKVRWTAEFARFRLPLAQTARGYHIRVHTVQNRPDEFPARPLFTFNQTLIPETHIHLEGRVHTLTIEPEWMHEDLFQFLQIKSNPWVPSKGTEIKDDRELGIMIHQFEVTPRP